MTGLKFLILPAVFVVCATSLAISQDNNAAPKPVIIGGAVMKPERNIIENLVSSNDHVRLIRAIKAADIVDVLSAKGPLTLFAPSDSAFGRIPRKAAADLMQPENRGTLAKVLKLHIVAERLAAADLTDGRKLQTLSGEELTVRTKGNRVMLENAKGDTMTVTTADAVQSNGIMHAVSYVLPPS